MPSLGRHEQGVLERQIHRLLAPLLLKRHIQVIRLVVAVIAQGALSFSVLHRCHMLQLSDDAHGNQPAHGGQYPHADSAHHAILSEVQLIAVSHGQSVNRRVQKQSPGGCRLVGGKLVNCK